MRTTDDEEFRAYVETRRGELLRTALYLTAGEQWGAEDLVQTALTRLYVAWARVRADTVDAYARRCLLNAFIDHRRLAFGRRVQVRAELPETVAPARSPTELRSVVFTALAQLPPRMRAAVVMRHLLDLSVEETARALGCRQGTVKSQTARGLEHLRAALAAQGVCVADAGSPEVGPAPHPRLASPRTGDLTIRS